MRTLTLHLKYRSASKSICLVCMITYLSFCIHQLRVQQGNQPGKGRPFSGVKSPAGLHYKVSAGVKEMKYGAIPTENVSTDRYYLLAASASTEIKCHGQSLQDHSGVRPCKSLSVVKIRVMQSVQSSQKSIKGL